MHRWWRIPRNWATNVYYHIVLRSDDDRALHDHPWLSVSIVLEGGYFEHTIDAGGINHKHWFGPGSIRFRPSGTFAHRLELPLRKVQVGFEDEPSTMTFMDDDIRLSEHKPVFEDQESPCTTIFITGPVLRRWGFHATDEWVDAYNWDNYCDAKGINAGIRMDGGSDAAESPRNLI